MKKKNELNRGKRGPDITEGSKGPDLINIYNTQVKTEGAQQQKQSKGQKEKSMGMEGGAKREQKKIKLGWMESPRKLEEEKKGVGGAGGEAAWVV